MKTILFTFILFFYGFLFSQKTYTLTPNQARIADSLKKANHNYEKMESEFINILNEYRVENKLTIMTRNSDLDVFAENQSKYIKETKICTHKNGNLTFQDRVNNYKTHSIQGENALIATYSYCVVGDTIMTMSESIFTLWKNSAIHNKIMLDNNINLKVGVSFIEDSNHIVYAVMVIAK